MQFTPNYALVENWEPKQPYTWTKTIAQGEITLTPIGRVLYPVLFHNSSIAIEVEVNSPDNTETWNYAGKALISINTGITIGGNTDTVIAGRSLFLHQINLLVFPKLAGDFRLEYSPPKWFQQVTLRAWEYIGEGIPDNANKLDAIGSLVSP